MERAFHITGDGSHTLYVKDLDETYHSKHGAIQESMHVFINQGLHTIEKSKIRILETGMGTGLNILLTMAKVREMSMQVRYHTVEKYPLDEREYRSLNYDKFIPECQEGTLEKIHESPWNTETRLNPWFTLYKEKADFRMMNPDGHFDLVYFDAFAPDKQPELWSPEIFEKVHKLMAMDGVFVTYSSKGSVRRNLAQCGFDVRKVAGPPGKREMIRAIKR